MGETYQSTVIDTSADRVWALLRDFHDFSWAENVIESCEPEGEKSGDEVGARRVLNGVFHETLLEHSDDETTLRYSIDAGPSPVSQEDVSDYVGTVRALPVTDTDRTFVEWSSSWRGNEEEARAFCHNIYTSLLQALNAHFEGR